MNEFIKCVLIVLTSFLSYGFHLEGDFVFDDSEAIVHNNDVAGLNFSLEKVFLHDFWGANITSKESHKSYRPLTILSFRLNYILSGYNLNAYHMKLTNLILHMISCLIIWQCFKVICKQQKNMVIDKPFYAAVLFAAHPVHTEAVSGIVGRADILAAICFFSGFLLYNSKVRKKWKYWHMFIVLLLAGVGMFFKETGITILGVCLAQELLIIFQHGRRTFKKTLHQIKDIKVLFLSFSAISLLLIRLAIMGFTQPVFQDISNPAAFASNFLTRFLSLSYIHSLNFIILIWPQWLCFDWSLGCIALIYGYKDIRLITMVFILVFLILLFKFLIISPNNLKKQQILTCLIILFVSYLPTSNLFFTVGFVIAERVLYIPSAAFCLLITIGLEQLCCYNSKFKLKILYYFLIVVFMLRSWERSSDWLTENKLFVSGMSVCPDNAKVRYNIGKVLADKAEIDEAIKLYEDAIRLYPKYYQAMNNLANLIREQNKLVEAEILLNKALEYKSDFPAAWMNLGIVLAQQSRFKESEWAYLMALKYRRNYPTCYYNLGNLYNDNKDEKRAIECWLMAIKQNPEHGLARTNLLILLDSSGRTQEALPHIEPALSILPNSSSIHYVVGAIYGKLEEFERAEKHFLRAIELKGAKVEATHYYNLGVLYHRWKRYDQAKVTYNRALQLDPNYKSAKQQLRNLENKK